LCLGEATKIAEYLMNQPKIYRGSMRLGAVSDTMDREGEITEQDTLAADDMKSLPAAELLAQLQEVARGFLGDIEQLPPLHSAKRVDGRRLYEYARTGEPVKVEPRVVTVYRYDILRAKWPEADFEVECGSGTYVRRLVHDLGEDLRCGAYLASLQRMRVGAVSLDDAVDLEAMRENPAILNERLMPVSQALRFWPHARVNADALAILRRGHAIPADWAPVVQYFRPLEWLNYALLLDEPGNVLAVARYVSAPYSPPPRELAEYRGAWFQPVKIFPHPIP